MDSIVVSKHSLPELMTAHLWQFHFCLKRKPQLTQTLEMNLTHLTHRHSLGAVI